MNPASEQEMQWMAERFPALVLGVPAIDRDHAHLLMLLGALEEQNQRTNPDMSLIWHILASLQEYTRHHFAREEELMEAARFESLDAHRAEHAALRDEVNGHARRFQSGQSDLDALTRFMQRWLIRHVAGSDAVFVKALKHSESRQADGERPSPSPDADQ